jgi:hypothetical protein
MNKRHHESILWYTHKQISTPACDHMWRTHDASVHRYAPHHFARKSSQKVCHSRCWEDASGSDACSLCNKATPCVYVFMCLWGGLIFRNRLSIVTRHSSMTWSSASFLLFAYWWLLQLWDSKYVPAPYSQPSSDTRPSNPCSASFELVPWDLCTCAGI